MMMPTVPIRQVAVKTHKKNRSNTIAINFQSSITCKPNEKYGVVNPNLSTVWHTMNGESDEVYELFRVRDIRSLVVNFAL